MRLHPGAHVRLLRRSELRGSGRDADDGANTGNPAGTRAPGAGKGRGIFAQRDHTDLANWRHVSYGESDVAEQLG
jgi:hypothetical protein